MVLNEVGELVPNATIKFSSALPEGVEMIPTVYITEDCMHRDLKGLAEKLVTRIKQMNDTHDIVGVKEIQIDCDYTAKSRQKYYQFLKEVKAAWKQKLSTTIRLHQLSMEEPPVDYGALMLYNTGDPRKWTERNPILDARDVRPYVKWLNDYPLPLAAAYPVFSCNVLTQLIAFFLQLILLVLQGLSFLFQLSYTIFYFFLIRTAREKASQYHQRKKCLLYHTQILIIIQTL